MGTSSDLQPDLISLSPLDYAGEYVALEIDPYAERVTCQTLMCAYRDAILVFLRPFVQG